MLGNLLYLVLVVQILLFTGVGDELPLSSLRVTGRSGQFEISLSVPKAEYAVGELMQVTMSLRNIGPGQVQLRTSSPWLFDFAVYDQSRKKIGTWAGGRPFPMTPPRPIVLQPGQVITRRLPWALAPPGPGRRKPLKPGRYGLQGFLAGRPGARSGSGRVGVYPLPLKTPLLFITVR